MYKKEKLIFKFHFLKGPITIYDYMKEVLMNPISGYYMKKEEVFGNTGDYITSPELSQMFGEVRFMYFYSVINTLLLFWPIFG